jgi:uncharacterized protein DUF4328
VQRSQSDPSTTSPNSGPPPAALPYEALRGLVPAIVLGLLAMALFLAFLLESLRGDQLTLSFELGGLPVGDLEIFQNHDRLARDTKILILLGVIVAVLWLVWQYRAHANLRALVRGTRFHPAVGVALWFIPVVNLVGPPLAMRELWRASHPERQDWRKAWTTPLLWLWWLSVLCASGLTWWALAPAWHAHPTTRELFVRDHRAVIAAGIGILTAVTAAVLIVLVNGRINQREDLVLGEGKWRHWAERRSRRR